MSKTVTERAARIESLAREVITPLVADDIDDDTVARTLGMVVGTFLISSDDPRATFETFRAALYTIIGDRGKSIMNAVNPVKWDA
jgi:hypothetical protein